MLTTLLFSVVKQPARRHGSLAAKVWVVPVWLALVVAAISPALAQPGTGPPLAPEVCDKINGVIDGIFDPEAVLTVPLNQSKLIRTKVDIARVSAADPSVVEVVPFDTREIELIGKQTGTTTMNIWVGTGEQAQVLTVLLRVDVDRTVDERRVFEYRELQNKLNALFPGSKIRLFPIADKVIVKGQARDAEEAERILSIVRAGGGGGAGAGGAGGGLGGPVSAQGTAAEPFPDGSTLPDASVISMLMIPGEQQVLLRVKIAELNRTAARRLGVSLEGEINEFIFGSILTQATSFFVEGTFSDGAFSVALDAMEEHGVAKVLAEPNLITLSGHTASFIAGGEFPVPTVVGVDGVGAATTTFRGFGVQLQFTPTIIDKDRIRLQVAPEFSAINTDNSVNGIFGLDTRAAFTTVNLREGQVLAIAGLIQDNQQGGRSRLPFLGKIPVLGAAFSHKEVTRGETELIIIVSPEIVGALDPKDAPPLLPGMDVNEPNDFDFYLRNRIEGRACDQFRSTVWPKYRDQLIHPWMNSCIHQQSEGYYVNGPCGLSE